MSNILAGVGRGQLEVLEDRVRTRRCIFNRYYEELSHIPGFCFMPELENTRSNRWLTTMMIDEKGSGISIEKLLKTLAEENIEARPTWKPLHMQPLLKKVSIILIRKIMMYLKDYLKRGFVFLRVLI